MTARWPRHGLTISTTLLHHTPSHIPSTRLILLRTSRPIRRYAIQHHNTRQQRSYSVHDPVKGALSAVKSRDLRDPLNPPRSTLPPPLDLPTRGNEQKILYYIRIGKAYGTFYKDGIKAVWNNWSAAKLLKQRLGNAKIEDAVRKGKINRAEFQLLARSNYDVGKLPVFGFLVLIFGEWLPLLVPFIPNAVPGTCRIPKQIKGMRMKAEERRRTSFRLGISEPGHEQLPSGLLGGKEENALSKDSSEWPLAFNKAYTSRLLSSLRSDQLLHLSSTLSLHSTIWDRLQLPPPSILLRHRIAKRLAYLAQDDHLLLRHRSSKAHLAEEELQLACTERGIDVLGKEDGLLRESLTWWLQRQKKDKGMGGSVMVMLFRRPNAWDTKAGLNAPRKQ